jgi:ABC-type dipeptide/oligopeptide/nickel transport system permease component
VTYIFGIIFKFFVPGGYISYRDDFWGFIGYIIFPAISVAIPKIAMTARFIRNSILTQMSMDYVRTAYSKGAGKKRVMYLHVFRNAMLPVITFVGMITAEVIAGSIVVEQVFALPGIGRLLISSISSWDLPVVEIIVLYVTAVVIIVYALVDVIYRLADPRISDR